MSTQPRNPAAIAAAIAISLCAVLCAAASADAAIRFAAPGGTGIDPCANPADPCTIFTAASPDAPGTTVRTGDEVVLASGEYSDSAGDLGPNGGFMNFALRINVHGATDGPRPLIRLNQRNASVTVNDRDIVSHLEVATSVASSPFKINAGTVEDVIVRSSTAGATACSSFQGVIRDTACLSSGAGASAIASSGMASIPITVQLRNVTAVATGAGSTGLRYQLTSTGGTLSRLDVTGKAVIAHGTANDVFAAALSPSPHVPGTGATARIDLDHSAYATVGTLTDAGGGTASVTLPGTAENITEPPLLAADAYHQLPGSPTVEAGAADAFTGTADLDGQLRTIGAGIDIGADELGHATSTQLSCLPAALTIGGGPSTCTVTVTDITPGGSAPTGTVAFSTTGPGTFSAGSCELGASIGASSGCQVAYTPGQPGSGTHTIEATYLGDEVRDPSRTTASISVPVPGGGGGGGAPPAPPSSSPPSAPPRTAIGKKPAKRTSATLAKFAFSSDQAGGSFECRLDRRPFRRCASPFRATVKPGSHSFEVRALDSGGIADPTPASYRWSVVRSATG